MNTSIQRLPRTSLINQAHFYFRRIVTFLPIRGTAIRLVQRFIGPHHGSKTHDRAKAATLKRDGVAQFNELLSNQQISDILKYFSDKPFHDRHDATPRYAGEDMHMDMQFGFYDTCDVLDCPHILTLVSSPRLVDLAAEYLGCVPTLCGLGVHWSFPATTPGTVQKFHRDSEDWKYLRFILYLTDVGETDGPHTYVKQSHQGRLPFRLRFYSTDEVEAKYGRKSVTKITGPAGTCVAADTSGIHKGELPVSAPRMALVFTYSILPPPLFEYHPVSSQHSDDLKNYTNRLYLQK